MVANYKEILYENETIFTQNLTLRRFKLEDAAAVLEYGSDAESLEFVRWGGIQTIEEAKMHIIDKYWARQGYFAVELNSSQKCIGCFFLGIIPEHEKASLGYVISRPYWGKGYATEALSALIELCFKKLEMNRFEAYHYVGNEASGRVMAKCGMKFEGVGIQEEKVKGIFRDIVRYGMTREDWMAGKD